MSCASNAIQNAEDDHMNKLSRKIKLLVFISAVLIVELFFLISFAGAVVKFRYITSLYRDDAGSAFQQPEGVACNNESALIVADTGNGRLLRFTFEEGSVRTGTVEYDFSNPVLARDRDRPRPLKRGRNPGQSPSRAETSARR